MFKFTHLNGWLIIAIIIQSVLAQHRVWFKLNGNSNRCIGINTDNSLSRSRERVIREACRNKIEQQWYFETVYFDWSCYSGNYENCAYYIKSAKNNLCLAVYKNVFASGGVDGEEYWKDLYPGDMAVIDTCRPYESGGWNTLWKFKSDTGPIYSATYKPLSYPDYQVMPQCIVPAFIQDRDARNIKQAVLTKNCNDIQVRDIKTWRVVRNPDW